MKVIFSHGKESGPWGKKIATLANSAKALGFNVDSIDYTSTSEPDKRVNILSEILAEEKESYVLVGSSMGGYVSVVNAMNNNAKGLFLLAPALYLPNYQQQQYSLECDCEIVHGWSDDVIPFANSVRFAEQHKASLHLIDGDHRLSSALPKIDSLFIQFLKSL